MKTLFSLIIISYSIFYGCPADASETIKVAAIFAKSSKMAFGNIEALNGVRFAVEELNSHGGLLGKQLELLEFDNRGSALGSKIAAQKAVEAGVVTVFGANWSSHSIAMAPVLQQARIPMITPISTNPDVTRVGNYIFRVCYIDPFQGEVLSRFALNSLHARTAVLLVNADDRYSEGLAEYFIADFEKNGGKILFVEKYLENTADFSTFFNSVQMQHPDVVFLPGHTKMSAFILRQAHHSGIRAVFLGGDGWNDSMYKIAGDAIDGHFYASHWHQDSPREKSRAFVEKYRIHKRDIIPVSALAEDSVFLFADAVIRANSFDPEKIRDAIAQTAAFNGITGTISFNEYGDPIKSAVILKFGDGKSIFVQNIEPK